MQSRRTSVQSGSLFSLATTSYSPHSTPKPRKAKKAKKERTKTEGKLDAKNLNFFSEFLFLSSCFFELLEDEPGILETGKMKSILTLVTWFLIFLYKLKQKWQIGVTTITGRGSSSGDFTVSGLKQPYLSILFR